MATCDLAAGEIQYDLAEHTDCLCNTVSAVCPCATVYALLPLQESLNINIGLYSLQRCIEALLQRNKAHAVSSKW